MITPEEHRKIIRQKNTSEEVMLPSFLHLFEQHKGMLYAVALKLLGHGEDAKDALQETFIKAYTHLHALQNRAAFAGWLKSIMFNHCLMELRSRKKSKSSLNEYIKEMDIVDAAYNMESAPLSVKSAVAALPEVLQITTMLRYFSKNSSYNQIACLLNIPVGTVRSRLAESRLKLSSVLTNKNCHTKNAKAKEMEDFYRFHFADLYDDASVRSSFFQHFNKHVYVSLTSGKIVTGVSYLEKEIEFDLTYGTRATLAEVNSTGNISVLELNNINPPDNPDLCPLAATFIIVHPHNKAEKIFLTMH